MESKTMIVRKLELLIIALTCTWPWVLVNGCGITILNQCGYAVTACAQHSNSDIAQYDLSTGGSIFLDFGSSCSWSAGVVYGSVQGKCAVDGVSYAATDRNYANLAEFTIGASGIDYYDLSNVNAYSHPLAIRPVDIANGVTPSGYRCGSPTCSINNISSFCQSNNVVHNFSTGSSSCVNTDGTAGIGPTEGTTLFKSQCPDAYSYNYDDATSTFTCETGTNYEVLFCP